MFEKIKTTVFGREAILVKNLGFYDLKDTFECGQCFRYVELDVMKDNSTTSPCECDKKEKAQAKNADKAEQTANCENIKISPCENAEETSKNRDKTQHGCDFLTFYPENYHEYITVVKDTLINVGQRERGELIFYSMTDEEFEEVARPYFALDTDLEEIRANILKRTDSQWLKTASESAKGIAILKQEPFETLISFIISQNNNIPRIRKIIKQICSEYGENLSVKRGLQKCPVSLINGTPCEELCKNCGLCYTFPKAQQILDNPEKLLPSKPGFRYKYILDACTRVASGEVDLQMIANARTYTYTMERLKEIKGVGDKVASCVALFGFNNLEAFPIDVWMKKAIEDYFDGNLNPESLGRYAGVAQQYIFYYIRNVENEKKNGENKG